MRHDTRFKIAALLFLLFSAFVTYADDPPFRVEPADPTSKERVTIFVPQLASCWWEPYVRRDGFSIQVELGESCFLEPPPPVVVTHRLDIGVLPPGTYTVKILNKSSVVGTGSFVVLDASGGFVVNPALASISGGSRVQIFGAGCITYNPCIPPVVTFGGIPVTDMKFHGWGAEVTVPPHAAGAVEVRIEGAETRRAYAFRYYDPAQPPLSVFERLLIPVIYNGPGANGSAWATEIAVRNNSETPIEYWRGAGDVAEIPAVASLTEALGEAPAGRFLFVPRDVAPSLRFGAIVRDVSRDAEDWGTELPVVREADYADTMDLVNVPVDPRFRHRLRIYARDSSEHWVLVYVYSMADGGTLAMRFLPLTSSDPCDPAEPCRSVRPATAQIDDLFTDLNVPGGKAGIHFETCCWMIESSPIWAFMTVTNNETQRVTMISPQ